MYSVDKLIAANASLHKENEQLKNKLETLNSELDSLSTTQWRSVQPNL